MKTLNWRHTDWNARNFIFSIGQEIIGQLTFNSSWNFNAVYTDKETKLKFSQKSFWDRDVLITKDGKLIGEIKNDFFLGTQTLKLPTGETFILSSNVWGRNVNWKNEKGETIVKYQQATMSSMGKGLISLNDSLTIETEKLLVSSGLFARQLLHKRVVLIVVIMIPILAASRR
jgi:hypothetical protein